MNQIKWIKSRFFTFDFQKHDPAQIEELARFQKGKFAIESIIEAASNLKYTSAASAYLKRQMENPDDDFIRLIGRQIHDGSTTKSVAEQLRPAIQAALDDLVRDRIQDRLSITFRSESAPQIAAPTEEPITDTEVHTTDEEREGFMIVRAIGAKFVPVDRITMRDSKSYCAILMDNNNRRPICRLYFNSATTKNLGVFDPAKNETRIRVSSPADIYQNAEAIEAAIKAYA